MSNTLDETPKQYKVGYSEFYKLKFKVTPDVLIPRPETELLVDAVLEFVYRHSSLDNSETHKRINLNLNEKRESETTITVLDIGTGAGNIAISLAKNATKIKIIATEVSKNALKIAKQNAKFHGVENKIEFIESDLLSSIPSTLITQPYSPIIVTNLPYIPSSRIPYLDSSVKDFEPHIALDGGEDGFELYRKLFQQIVEKGWQPDLILGEIDYTHGEIAASEAQKFFPKSQVEVKTDLAHKQRILVIKSTP